VEACYVKGGQGSRNSISQIPVGELAYQNCSRDRWNRGGRELHLLGEAISLHAEKSVAALVSLDHLVGASEQSGGNLETDRLRGPHIDNHLAVRRPIPFHSSSGPRPRLDQSEGSQGAGHSRLFSQLLISASNLTGDARFFPGKEKHP
jgi:hypothetical protein